MRYAFCYLEQSGYECDSIGLYPDDNGNIDTSNAVLLPIPTTKDKVNVFCPLTNKEIPLDFVNGLPEDKLVLSGNLTLDRKNTIRYDSYEEFAVLNAVLTAEGAISEVIKNTDYALFDARILITGFGRVSKALLSRLIPFSKNITVSARKALDFAYLNALNINYINTYEINKSTEKYDIIFNSIDAPILNNCENLLENTLIADLSTLGCIQKATAESLGAQYIKMSGLPGKTAPKSAGKIISDTVISILNARR